MSKKSGNVKVSLTFLVLKIVKTGNVPVRLYTFVPVSSQVYFYECKVAVSKTIRMAGI